MYMQSLSLKPYTASKINRFDYLFTPYPTVDYVKTNFKLFNLPEMLLNWCKYINVHVQSLNTYTIEYFLLISHQTVSFWYCISLWQLNLSMFCLVQRVDFNKSSANSDSPWCGQHRFQNVKVKSWENPTWESRLESFTSWVKVKLMNHLTESNTNHFAERIKHFDYIV